MFAVSRGRRRLQALLACFPPVLPPLFHPPSPVSLSLSLSLFRARSGTEPGPRPVRLPFACYRTLILCAKLLAFFSTRSAFPAELRSAGYGRKKKQSLRRCWGVGEGPWGGVEGKMWSDKGMEQGGAGAHGEDRGAGTVREQEFGEWRTDSLRRCRWPDLSPLETNTPMHVFG